MPYEQPAMWIGSVHCIRYDVRILMYRRILSILRAVHRAIHGYKVRPYAPFMQTATIVCDDEYGDALYTSTEQFALALCALVCNHARTIGCV